ncbi:MAG: TIGR01906 family membrane protein [Anaerolineales bacterium]
MSSRLSSLLSWLVALLIPLALLGLGLRLLLTPVFLQIEYNLPGFPPDEYGFTTTDRLYYAPFALDYLLNDQDISYLGRLTFPDGAPLFTARELSHMQDVKIITQASLKIWYATWLLLFLLGIWAWQGKRWQAYRQGLRRGGWLMMGLTATVGLFAALAFWQFFSLFHALFFEGDSWLFLYSDTLIRLFPMQFWQDAFLYAALIAVLGALGLILGIRPQYEESTPR